MPSVGRVYPSLADCAPPPPSSRRACQPFLKGRPPRNALFPVNLPKSGAPHSSAFAPPGQTASPPHPRSAPCPIGARQRRPTRAVPTRHHSSTSAASTRPALPSTPTSPSPKNRRRRRAPARGPAAVCALHRPARNAKKRPCPLLVGHGRVKSGPKATGRRHCRPRGAWARRFRAKGAGRRHRRLEYFRGARIYYSHHAGAPAEKEW